MRSWSPWTWRVATIRSAGGPFREAQAVGFPLRLARCLIMQCSRPIYIQASGSHSSVAQVFQGIQAGCSHAAALLSALLFRSLKDTGLIYRSITPTGADG
eukprot:2069714-Pyramimonas_sp.AAC.1